MPKSSRPPRDPARAKPVTTGLPQYDTPLVGRAGELAALEQALADDGARLHTLVGPPGVGKTRLAVTLAARLAPAFDGAVRFVSVRSLEPGRLGAAIARAVELREDPPASLERGLEALGPTLVVLDEAEGHLDECAALLPRLLAASATVRFLVTSRAVLGVRDERALELPLLRKPRAPEELAQSEAGALYLARLEALGAPFRDEPGERARAVQLLDRLGDLPLIVELVAGQAAVFGTRALTERLDGALDWLDTDARDEPRRSLRFALDESYARLSEEERKALLACALFVEHFDVAFAATVSGVPAILRTMRALRHSSWLQANADGDGAVRFSLLSPLRDYLARRAREELDASELHAMRVRHAKLAFEWASRGEREGALREELAAALRFSVREPALHAEALGALRGAFGVFSAAGALREFVELARPLVPRDAAEGEDPRADRARVALGRALRDLGQLDEARALLDEVRARAERSGDEALRAAATGAVANLLFKAGRYGELEALRAGDVASDRPEEIEGFATAATIRGDRDAAVRIYVNALGRSEGLRAVERAVLHACYARFLAESGEHERALRESDLAAAACADPPRTLAASLSVTRALVAHDAGRFDEAIALYDEAIARYAAPASPIVAYLAFVRALATLETGRTDEARAAFRAARQRDNAAMEQLRPLVALGDWVVDAVAPDPHAAIADEVVRSTYRLVTLLVARERGSDVDEELTRARAAHETHARWSVVGRVCLRLTALSQRLGRATQDALLIDRAGRWFAPPGGQVVSLAQRPLLQRVLKVLATLRTERAGEVVSFEDLGAEVWPGEKMSAQSRKNRVYVAVSSLRTMGLGALLEGTKGGYRLDPSAPCVLR